MTNPSEQTKEIIDLADPKVSWILLNKEWAPSTQLLHPYYEHTLSGCANTFGNPCDKVMISELTPPNSSG